MNIADDDDNDDNVSTSLAVLRASMSSLCGTSTGCDEGDGHQILWLAGNILNKQQRTSDKGGPPVWWLGVLLTIQQLNNLPRYGIFHISSDWGRHFGTV
jgi:hypothetical protein